MEKKFSLTLDKEFTEYCRINNIEDVEKFGKEVFDKGFNMVKYGSSPFKPFVPPPKPKPVLSNEESIPKEKITEVIEKTKEYVKDKDNLYGE